MKIFGLGLSRTGTSSLSTALNILGFRSIHGPHDEKTKSEITSGQLNLSLFETHNAITDIPMALYFEDLDQLFPNSKFILTVRDMSDWLASMKRHYIRRGELTEWRKFIRSCAYGCWAYNEQRLLIAHKQHVASVRDYFKTKNNFLTLNICEGEGWEPLCKFLDLPKPDIPFPWNNRDKSHQINLL